MQASLKFSRLWLFFFLWQSIFFTHQSPPKRPLLPQLPGSCLSYLIHYCCWHPPQHFLPFTVAFTFNCIVLRHHPPPLSICHGRIPFIDVVWRFNCYYWQFASSTNVVTLHRYCHLNNATTTTVPITFV